MEETRKKEKTETVFKPHMSLFHRIGSYYYWIAIMHMLFCLLFDMLITIPTRFIQRRFMGSKKEFEGFIFQIMWSWMKFSFHLNGIDYIVDKPVR